jgi:RimJ/RimL family protein N-acetyltransferase
MRKAKRRGAGAKRTAVMTMDQTHRITLKSKSGVCYSVGSSHDTDCSSILDMYRVFSPKPASQGLPPADTETCEKWVKDILEVGLNVVARIGDKIIGHAALIPDGKRHTGEFIIFVHQDCRNLGVGTELTRWTFERARGVGFQSIWLTVAVNNFIAIKLYRKLGFEYCEMDDCERTMVVKL